MEVLTIAKEKNLPINGEIRCSQMLVIGPKGEQLGVKSKSDASSIDTVTLIGTIDQDVNENWKADATGLQFV